MAEQGFYNANGIQNSGTGLKNGNVNCYIYNSSGSQVKQIYPREATVTLSNNDFGSFKLDTYRDSHGWGWRHDVAYQGVKSVSRIVSQGIVRCWGHIVPSNMPRFSNLIAVEYVKISYMPHRCGIHASNRDLTFNVALDNNDCPTLGSARCIIVLGANQDTVRQNNIDSNSYPNLIPLFEEMLRNGVGLCLKNDETALDLVSAYYDGTGYGSKNYAAISEFRVEELRVKYQP